jgi:penicillin-binding protein 1A
MALGAGSVTVWQMARAYSVFANSGYLIQPYYIQKIVDDRGNNLGVANPQHAGDESLRVVDARNAFIMDSMLQDVTRYGTAARASKLGRKDIAGKTGTTNDFLDAWFCGYSPALVGIAWVGFDQPRTLGRNETGGGVALPIWIGYMEKALKGVPEIARVAPEGVVNLKVDAEGSGSHQEFFYKESLPPPPPPPPPQERERAPALQPGETPEFKPLPSMSRIDRRGRFAPAEAARQEG